MNTFTKSNGYKFHTVVGGIEVADVLQDWYIWQIRFIGTETEKYEKLRDMVAANMENFDESQQRIASELLDEIDRTIEAIKF